MENFIVSARKYRPATFNTVVGQSHITNTLKNAIKTGHLAQAFLFCGPRGVGKTTCARILAKTINCTNRTADTEACDQCESCISFNSGASLNVSELDAASNNSVDDIRNLVDQVRYAPQLGTHKVYIIDEVHMLSTSAFNAFLKTLEEPPRHAIFILATTEKHKIIPTILSRCQIFDFNRIQIEDIANHLAYIANNEHITAETDALHIIAQKADGALRDACSIFDQIVSFAGNTITYKAVIDNLNILDYDYYFKVTDALLAQNISASLLLFNEILNNGFDGHNFVAGMGDHFRNLLVSKDTETLQLLEVGKNIKEKYKQQSNSCSLSFLIKGLTLLNKADVQYKASKNQRLQVELALMQLCSIGASATVEAEKKNHTPEPIAAPQGSAAPVKPASSNPVPSAPPANTTAPATPVAAPVKAPDPVASTEQQPTVTKKPIIKSSTPSINQHLTAEKKTETTAEQGTEISSQAPGTQPYKDFTLDALHAAWEKYANELKGKGKSNLGIALLSKRPSITEKTTIEFVINNKALEEAINEDKMNFLGFLRKELQNYNLQLNLQLSVTEDKTNLYTATDRYNRLVEKNPMIKKFRQTFDLDIEF
ncbi:MAG TPA: DNA polymerase III subunit gamma/tau [Bacteroidia bacterium]|jgi:DNA polymerase-3 subunit gamma/tau|nr:DNA polymerase III subunit gamma/tau [Bacteroidia bacterium]